MAQEPDLQKLLSSPEVLKTAEVLERASQPEIVDLIAQHQRERVYSRRRLFEVLWHEFKYPNTVTDENNPCIFYWQQQYRTYGRTVVLDITSLSASGEGDRLQINDIITALEKKNDDTLKAELSYLERFLMQLPPSDTLTIIDSSGVDGRNGIYTHQVACKQHTWRETHLRFDYSNQYALALAVANAERRGVSVKASPSIGRKDSPTVIDATKGFKLILYQDMVGSTIEYYRNLISELERSLNEGDYLIVEVTIPKTPEGFVASEEVMFNRISSLGLRREDVRYEVLVNEVYWANQKDDAAPDEKCVKVRMKVDAYSGDYVQAYFTFTRDVTVTDDDGNEFKFLEGEKLHTQASRIFDDKMILEEFKDDGFALKDSVTDNDGSLKLLFRKMYSGRPHFKVKEI